MCSHIGEMGTMERTAVSTWWSQWAVAEPAWAVERGPLTCFCLQSQRRARWWVIKTLDTKGKWISMAGLLWGSRGKCFKTF